MAEPYVDVVEWARTARSDDPHDLRDLEDVLLRRHPDNLARLSREPREVNMFLFGVLVIAYGLAGFAPLFGPVWFTGATLRQPGNAPVDISEALLVSAIAFWAAVAFFVGQFVEWWRGGRYRSLAAILYALLAIACGLFTLYAANDGLDELYGNPTIYLVPIWVAIIVAVLTIVVHAVSPKDPERTRTNNLTQESRALLVSERGAALEVLVERGMLSEPSVATLNARPLGELHRPQEARRG